MTIRPAIHMLVALLTLSKLCHAHTDDRPNMVILLCDDIGAHELAGIEFPNRDGYVDVTNVDSDEVRAAKTMMTQILSDKPVPDVGLPKERKLNSSTKKSSKNQKKKSSKS